MMYLRYFPHLPTPYGGCVLDVNRAHAHLRWKTTKRAISFTVPGTFCKTDVREYNTLFTLSELLFFILDKSKMKYPTYRPPSKYTFRPFFSARVISKFDTPKLFSKKKMFLNFLKVVYGLLLVTHVS